jgi:hypothetical protein
VEAVVLAWIAAALGLAHYAVLRWSRRNAVAVLGWASSIVGLILLAFSLLSPYFFVLGWSVHPLIMGVLSAAGFAILIPALKVSFASSIATSSASTAMIVLLARPAFAWSPPVRWAHPLGGGRVVLGVFVFFGALVQMTAQKGSGYPETRRSPLTTLRPLAAGTCLGIAALVEESAIRRYRIGVPPGHVLIATGACLLIISRLCRTALAESGEDASSALISRNRAVVSLTMLIFSVELLQVASVRAVNRNRSVLVWFSVGSVVVTILCAGIVGAACSFEDRRSQKRIVVAAMAVAYLLVFFGARWRR